jgi:hypothetical protein
MNRLFIAAAALLAASTAFAEDVLVLTNGREARGKIVEETPLGVKLDVGAGKLFYPRDTVREIRRGSTETKPAPAAAEAPAPDDAREEYALLYEDGRRVGTRTLRVARTPAGFRFEEEVVWFDEKGAPAKRTHSTERCDADFLPVAFQLRETSGEAEHRLTSGEVRGGRLYLTIAKSGDKTLRDDVLPAADARFPFAARECFLRRSASLGGKFELKVFDPRDELWRSTSYVERGTKPLERDGMALTLRVVVRKRGDVSETEWIDGRLHAHMSELAGEKLRALGSTKDVVARVKRGDADRETGPASAAKTRYVDPDAGFRIGKPDPSWTFEAPDVRGGGALLTVRNAPLFATVDVMKDAAAPADDTIERAAEALQRTCRAVAPNFRVVKDGFLGEGAARTWWCEATATTKGEKTKTLARVVVGNGSTFRVLAACPEGAFEALRPDLEKILASFQVD